MVLVVTLNPPPPAPSHWLRRGGDKGSAAAALDTGTRAAAQPSSSPEQPLDTGTRAAGDGQSADGLVTAGVGGRAPPAGDAGPDGAIRFLARVRHGRGAAVCASTRAATQPRDERPMQKVFGSLCCSRILVRRSKRIREPAPHEEQRPLHRSAAPPPSLPLYQSRPAAPRRVSTLEPPPPPLLLVPGRAE